MTWAPHVTVAAIIEDEGKFLFVEENTTTGIKLNQPAGHLEPNETIIAAVIRETQEETARTVEPHYLTGIYRIFSSDNDCTYLRFCFYCKVISHDEQQALDPDIIRTLWLTENEITQNQNMHRSPLVLQCLSDYIAGQHYPLSLLHDELVK
ncbi:MAG: NUDIX hydrolase [Gammaproteobacteria bacterium]